MKGTNQELMAHESLRARTGKIARRFLGFGLKQQILCVAWFVLGYFYPLAGVVLYFVQKKRGSEPVWRFFSLAGPIFAAAIFTANFIFYSINGFA
ncbi:MAG: hypothetical protein LKH62_06690 [Atopobiaceae bacterium]|jgi:hypothetical protein|nr:hypothetical protein [Atopobiaceae bacterium]MCI1540135.1 hypothetical protein [Atopobiaceae bacterium]